MSTLVDGSRDRPLLVVTDAPSRADAACGIPLSDNDGSRVWRMLSAAGVSRDSARVVCVVGEPPEKKVPNGRGRYVISERQLARDRQSFYEAVAESEARIVLALGGPALLALTGLKGGVDAWRGYLVFQHEFPANLVVKLPAVRYRKSDTKCKCAGYYWEEFEGPKGGKKRRRIRTIDSECKVCGGAGVTKRKGDPIVYNRKVEVPPPAAEMKNFELLITTMDPVMVRMGGFTNMPVFAADLKRVGRALRGELRFRRIVTFDEFPTHYPKGEMIAVDIETNWRSDGSIGRVGFANANHTWTRHWDGSGQAASRAILADSTRRVIIHNVGFDEPKLRAAGAPIAGECFCTMLGTYMVQPDGKKGLNYAAPLFLDVERWKHRADENAAKYNALDVRHEYDLYAPIVRELERTGQRSWFETGVMPAVRTLIRMSERGLRVDEQRMREWKSRLEVENASWTQQWIELVGTVNPNSSPQLCKMFNLPSCDEDALKEAYRRSGDTRISVLLAMRSVRKLLSTYTELDISADGCVHPSYLPGAKDDDSSVGKGIAYSGRWTARDPNIQQQPPEARKLYVPHTPGNVLVEADWRQFELRATAAMSGDKLLAHDLDASDFFALLAAEVGCERKVAKTGVYLTAYLGAPKTLHTKFRMEGVNINYSECVAFQKKLFARYARWAGWRQEVIREADAKRELRNPFGKWAPFPGGKENASRAVNFPPQSVNACVATIVLPQVEKALAPLGGRLLTLVHDSLLAEAPRENVLAVSKAMRELMEQRWDVVAPGFRVPVEVKVGSNWGEMVNDSKAVYEETFGIGGAR